MARAEDEIAPRWDFGGWWALRNLNVCKKSSDSKVPSQFVKSEPALGANYNDLVKVVTAWAKLPAPLNKAAIDAQCYADAR